MASTAWPALNAGLNATSALLVTAGFACIRAHRVKAHRRCMTAACAVSLCFFVSYLLYHARVGSVPFRGAGWSRSVYVAILISHTVLAIVIAPLVMRTLWLAVRERIAQHRRLARWTLPLWLYVSVSGVVVYWMLYRMP